GLPEDYYKTYLERLEKITPADVQQAARKYLDPNRMHIIIVGNESEVADKLLAFDGDQQIDFYDAKANKIEKMADDTGGEEEGKVSAESVVERYIQALGGRDNVEAIQSFLYKHKASTPMGDVTTTMEGKDNTKVHMKVEASGMVVQEITFDGL